MTLLKKAIAISLLFVFLGAKTELHQLLRLPVLIHHFLDHHYQELGESFADFLNQHYSDHQNHSDGNHHDHDNLPFKATDCAKAHFSLAFVNPIPFFIPRPTAFYDKIPPTYNGAFYYSSIVSKIWQPPKIS